MPRTPDTAAREIVDAEAAFGWLGKELLSKATNLRWLQAPQAAPAAGYYYPELVSHPVSVTNFREIYNDHIGAHILAFVLAFARGLHVFIPQQLRREWKKSPAETGDVVHLPEATALVVGLGGIGAEAARLLAAFGVTVLATDARRTAAPDGVAELHPPEALDDLLPRADFVILTVPHTPATEGFFNRARFQRMKRTAFFINIGRGMTTRLDDLVAALQAGEIAGAALDVYELEPLPGEHPLWTCPTCCSRRTWRATGPTSTSVGSRSWRTTAAPSPPGSRCAIRSTRRPGSEGSRQAVVPRWENGAVGSLFGL